MNRNYLIGVSLSLVLGLSMGTVYAGEIVHCPTTADISQALQQHKATWLADCETGSELAVNIDGGPWGIAPQSAYGKQICSKLFNNDFSFEPGQEAAGAYALAVMDSQPGKLDGLYCFYNTTGGAGNSPAHIKLTTGINRIPGKLLPSGEWRQASASYEKGCYANDPKSCALSLDD